MTSNPQTQISQHFQWDTPWSVEWIAVACVVFVLWSLWQLIREGIASQLHWWILFILTRTTVAGVMLWMILGPTTVLKRTEVFPRTLAVYLDTSSSMQIQDSPNPISDLRWQLTGSYRPQALVAADRAAFFASTLRQQSRRLVNAIEEQWSDNEKLEIAHKWQQLAEKCLQWLESDTLNRSLSNSQQKLHQDLQQMLKDNIQALLLETNWIVGRDPGDRDQRLQQLTETADDFVVRCRGFAEEIAATSITGKDASIPTTDAPSRLQYMIPAVQQSLSEWHKTGNESYRICMSQFSDSTTSLSLDDWESSLNGAEESAKDFNAVRRTDFSDLLKQIRDDAGKEDIGAALILTDGRHTVESPEDPRDIVGQLRMPLFLVPIGHGEMQRDLILCQVHAPNSVIQKDKILIDGIVTAHRYAGESCSIRLLEGNKQIETVRVTFKADQDDQRFHFEIPTEKIGRREFKVEVEKLPEEHSTDNNSRSLAVEVTDAVLRILLADGRSRWEHQYLVNLFNRQDTIELDQLKFTPTPIGTGRLQDRPRFPETVQEWSEYRLVILGDVSPRQLSQKCQQALQEYVNDRGGSLIIIAGQNDMPQAFGQEPLEQLLPVENDRSFKPDKQGYRVEMTTEGKTSDVMQFADDVISTEQIWRETSASLPIYFLSTYHKPKPNSQVFLSAVGKKDVGDANSPAFLCWQTVGAGRVAYFSSPATYQLRNRNGDKFHHRFWGQLVRWIITRSTPIGSKCVKLMADKSNYRVGDTAQIIVELTNPEGQPVKDATPLVDVIKRGEVIANVVMAADSKIPGRYLGSYAATDDGRYTLRTQGVDVERLLKAEKYFAPVQRLIEFEQGLDRELADPRNDRPLLEQFAEQTGGVVLEPTALAEVPNAVSLLPRILESSQKTTLWDRWWCLWVILGCLTLEWVIRKQTGLA